MEGPRGAKGGQGGQGGASTVPRRPKVQRTLDSERLGRKTVPYKIFPKSNKIQDL